MAKRCHLVVTFYHTDPISSGDKTELIQNNINSTTTTPTTTPNTTTPNKNKNNKSLGCGEGSPPPYLRQLLSDSLIVFNTSGVETYGAAWIHFAERHLLW